MKGALSPKVSMPCQELFNQQSSDYKNEIIDKEVPAITIEASSVCSWEKYSKNNMGIETFGESGLSRKFINTLI